LLKKRIGISKRKAETGKKNSGHRKNSLTWATDGIDLTVCALFLSLYG
jgi:hypothetical protein